MFKLILIFLISILVGCAQIGVCDYPLTENGWKAVKTPPSEFVDKYNYKEKWFINNHGQYLSCPEMVGKNHCGGIYAFYPQSDAKPNDATEYIVCMT